MCPCCLAKQTWQAVPILGSGASLAQLEAEGKIRASGRTDPATVKRDIQAEGDLKGQWVETTVSAVKVDSARFPYLFRGTRLIGHELARLAMNPPRILVSEAARVTLKYKAFIKYRETIGGPLLTKTINGTQDAEVRVTMYVDCSAELDGVKLEGGGGAAFITTTDAVEWDEPEWATGIRPPLPLLTVRSAVDPKKVEWTRAIVRGKLRSKIARPF